MQVPTTIHAALVAALALAGSAAAAPASEEPRVEADHLKAQRDAARKAYDLAVALYPIRRADMETVYRWSRRWLDAEQELSGTRAERTAALDAHLERMKKLEQTAGTAVRLGARTTLDTAAAEFYRAEAERWLAREKGSR